MVMLSDLSGARVLLTDSDRFPMDDDSCRLLHEADIAIDLLPGHDTDAIVKASQNVQAILVYSGHFDRVVIESLGPSCSILARCGVGYDNIDVVAARKKGIAVTYVPAYGAEDVAEHTFALILASSRRLGLIDRAVQAGGWPSYVELRPMRRIAGRSLGLLGFGRIAQQVALRAKGFRFDLLAHDPYVDETLAHEFGVELVTFEELLRDCDYLSVHLPLTEGTRNLINEQALSQMRPGACIINTSRGAIIDEKALARALEDGRLAGAGLDVLGQEPPEVTNRLLGQPNVLITSHSAAYTEEALTEVMRTALMDVLAVLKGEVPLYLVPELNDV